MNPAIKDHNYCYHCASPKPEGCQEGGREFDKIISAISLYPIFFSDDNSTVVIRNLILYMSEI